MKKNGLKIGLLSLFVLVAGYALGAYIGWPNTDSGLLSGNIGKANKFSKAVASPELKAFEEKIRTDEEFKTQTIFSLAYINSRTLEFQNNAEMAAEATSEIEEMKEFSIKMNELAKFAKNASKASGDAMEALNQILGGDENVSYEELSNNAIISYLLLDKGLALAQQYVLATDAFLEGKTQEDYSYLAFTRDQWAAYSNQDALMNDNKEMLAFWSSKGKLLDDQSTKTLVASLDPSKIKIWNQIGDMNSLFSYLRNSNQSKLAITNEQELTNFLNQLGLADRMDLALGIWLGDMIFPLQLENNPGLLFNTQNMFQFFAVSNLGIWNSENLGIWNSENLGIWNTEK